MREVAVLVAAAACGPTIQEPSKAPMIDNCTQAIRNFAAGIIASTKLAESCTLADAIGALEALKTARDSIGNLGTDRVQRKWRAIQAGVAGERLIVWHDGEHVVAIELEAPRVAGGWDELRTALGAPDAKLAYWSGLVENEDGHWVYASRGLALYTKLAETELERVVVFAPTTLDLYRAKLARATEPPREFEDR